MQEILKKYAGTGPEPISNQEMNEYLKELGQIAAIEEDVILTKTKGGKRGRETFRKWELITTYAARRSFAGNTYLQNVPTISSMKIAGHRTEKSFLKYIQISQEDNANKLISDPFFR